jgi:hypothetical protein
MIGGVWLVLRFDARNRGAIEEQLVALAGRLRDERVPTTMVFARPPAAFPAGDLRGLGVDVRHVSFSAPAQALRRLAGWFVAERPALVHFHFVDAYSRYVQAAKVAGAQTMVHDHVALEPASGVRGVFEKLRGAVLNPLVDRRVAVSAYVAETVRRAHGVPQNRVEVVENAVDHGLDAYAEAMSAAYRRLVPWLAVRPGRSSAGASEPTGRRGVA